MKLSYLVAVVLVGSTLLTACGKSGGGGNNASTPAASFNGQPAGYIGNGQWQGQVTVAEAQKPTFYQLAALTGLCYAQGCYQSSYFSVTVQLNSNNGGYNPYPVAGQPTTTAVTTQGGFSLRGQNGSFTRQCAEISGGSASFQMRAGVYSQGSGCSYTQPIAAGEPVVQINGQFTDASLSVLNIQVFYNGAQIGTGQLFCRNGQCNGGYGNNGGYYNGVNNGGQYYQDPYYYQSGYTVNPYQGAGNLICVGGGNANFCYRSSRY